MGMGKLTRKRKWIITLGVVFGGLIIFLIALPLWFPWILKPALRNYGVDYASYERSGYGKFILHDATFANDDIKFAAKEIEAVLPANLLWRNFKNDARNDYLRVTGWELEILDDKQRSDGTNSAPQVIVEKIDSILDQVNRWIPRATLENGVIQFSENQFSVSAQWMNRSLTGEIGSTNLLPITQFDARFPAGQPKKISLKTPDWDIETKLIVEAETTPLQLNGELFWQSNRVEITARFGTENWLPESASIEAKSFRVPANHLKLQGYRDLTGSLNVRWETNRFAVDLTANAEPIEDNETLLSPIAAIVHANGDTNSVRLETVTIFTPWLEANLSENVEFSFTGEMLSDLATLNVAADLSQQKWIAAVGKLRGKAVLRRSDARFPEVNFNLAGEAIEVGEIQIEQLGTKGKLEWPWLEIESTNVRFKDGATAETKLRFDAVARQIEEGDVKLNGQFGHQFLPPDLSYKNISLVGNFSGPLTNISHDGHVELQGVNLPNLTPLNLVADWAGTQLNLNKVQATIAAKDSLLSLAGSFEMNTNQFAAQFQKLDLATNGTAVLTLAAPFAISATERGTNWTVEVEPARWSQGETNLSIAGKVQWPDKGNLAVSAQKIDSSLASDFFVSALPEMFLERMEIAGNWTNGPVEFDATALARFRSDDGTLFSAELQAGGDAEGISILKAVGGTESEAVVTGKGFLPITFEPANASNLIQVLPKQRIDFLAETTPNPQFWERVARWVGADFRDPNISIALSGTVDSPTGKVRASAKEIVLKFGKPGQPIPRFENLVADFDLVRDRVALNRFEILVEGQPVRATGELPLPKKFDAPWKEILDWRKANANLQIVDAQIASFARLFPELVAPLGTFNLDVRAARGQLDGELRLEDAALRPISTLGSVHDISASAKFAGETVRLESFRGSIGGQPVEFSGEINLGKRDATTELPVFNFKLTGTNVPLARRPELILRSDIELSISNGKGGQPLISGTVNLRDSFYLSDLKLLIPGKVARPKQRPPYFSVEAEPFSKWRLNVVVRGDEFLRVRSPLFRGEISANLKVEGTLLEPVALGDARINSGVIQFPFANLRVERGFVSLTSENPYRPQLSVNASSRTFGYDVQMDISGFADAPTVEFSSNPGLTSEQILLMVTAGELPRDQVDFTTQQKAGRLAFFLGKNLFSRFGSGDAEEKLEIRSGEEVSESGQQTYYIEYKLSDDWSIVGEYDRFGGVNAGFKWKFFEK